MRWGYHPIYLTQKPILWLGILLDVSMASDETKEAILDFSKRYVFLDKVICSKLIIIIRIQNMVFPESMIDVVQWHQDKDRQSWHTHCAKMDDILGDNSDFDLSTLAKPTGLFGAALHLQWHYPVDAKRQDGLQHRHVAVY
ncbi:hypothetical protein J3E69DRAFT_321121 [Trichoderma sp. SZMC 28015]